MTEVLFDFDELVLHEFGFLGDYGFTVFEHNETRIGFGSEIYEIYIYYGRRSFEVGLEFGPKIRTEPGSVSIRSLLAVFNRNEAESLPPQSPITTGQALRERVTLLAEKFRQCVKPESLRSMALWDLVVAEAREQFEKRYPSISESQLQARFQKMWENKDYVGLLRLFEALEDHLTPDEKAKLDAARRALGRE